MFFFLFLSEFFIFLVKKKSRGKKKTLAGRLGLERGAEQERHSADIRGVQREIDDLRAAGRKERIDRGILSNKLLLSRKGQWSVCARWRMLVRVSGYGATCEHACTHGRILARDASLFEDALFDEGCRR